MKVNIEFRAGFYRDPLPVEIPDDTKPECHLRLALEISVKTRANLDGANLDGANLARAYLVGANLDGANLARVNLARANLARANLTRANLDGANLDGANLDGANLARAYLVGANLTRAHLDWANLDGANLTRANLDGANLAGAYLARAYLDGAKVAKIVARAMRGDGHEFFGFATDHGIIVKAGCRLMSPAEYRAHIAAVYPNTDKATETTDILDYIERRAASVSL